MVVPNREQQTRRFSVTSFEGRLKGVREKILLVVARGSWDPRDPQKAHVFATSHRSLDAGEVVRRYALRWKIEPIFREVKDTLRFDEYQVRKLRAIERHWELVLVAHTYLQLSLRDRPRRSNAVRQERGGRPCRVGDALRAHRALQELTNQRWVCHHRRLYTLIAVTQPIMRVTGKAA